MSNIEDAVPLDIDGESIIKLKLRDSKEFSFKCGNAGVRNTWLGDIRQAMTDYRANLNSKVDQSNFIFSTTEKEQNDKKKNYD